MILTLANQVAAVFNAVLATVVVMRYGRQRSAWLFVAVVALQFLLAVGNTIRRSTVSQTVAFVTATGTSSVLALLALALLLLFAALYAPEWWRRPRLIALLAAPYVLAPVLLIADAALGSRLLIGGMSASGGAFARVVPGTYGIALASCFAAGWLVHLGLLGTTFVRQPAERRSLLLMLCALVGSSVMGSLVQVLPALEQVSGVTNQVLVMGALSYLLLRRRVFETTKVALDQALQHTVDGVTVLSLDCMTLYANAAAETLLGLRTGQPLTAAIDHFEIDALRTILDAERSDIILATLERIIAVRATPITDHAGKVQGHLLLTRDITGEQRTRVELEQREATLQGTVAALQAAQAGQRELAETLRRLSLPVIPVADGVLVFPVIGVLDAERAVDFEGQFLMEIGARGAHTALIDLTGVATVDESGAELLMRAVRGAGLLGARTTLVGVRPDMAQAIVGLGLSWSHLVTAATLQEALATLDRAPTPRRAQAMASARVVA